MASQFNKNYILFQIRLIFGRTVARRWSWASSWPTRRSIGCPVWSKSTKPSRLKRYRYSANGRCGVDCGYRALRATKFQLFGWNLALRPYMTLRDLGKLIICSKGWYAFQSFRLRSCRGLSVVIAYRLVMRGRGINAREVRVFFFFSPFLLFNVKISRVPLTGTSRRCKSIFTRWKKKYPSCDFERNRP